MYWNQAVLVTNMTRGTWSRPHDVGKQINWLKYYLCCSATIQHKSDKSEQSVIVYILTTESLRRSAALIYTYANNKRKRKQNKMNNPITQN